MCTNMSRIVCFLLLVVATATTATTVATTITTNDDTASFGNAATNATTENNDDKWSIKEIQEDFLRVVKDTNKIPWRGLRGSARSQQPEIAKEVVAMNDKDTAAAAAAIPRVLPDDHEAFKRRGTAINTRPKRHRRHRQQRVLTDANAVATAAHVLESIPLSPSIFSSLFSMGLYYLGGTTTASTSQPTAQPTPLPTNNEPSTFTDSDGGNGVYYGFYFDDYFDDISDVDMDDNINPSPCLYKTCYGYTCDHLVAGTSLTCDDLTEAFGCDCSGD